jgi:hypothetical protein
LDASSLGKLQSFVRSQHAADDGRRDLRCHAVSFQYRAYSSSIPRVEQVSPDASQPQSGDTGFFAQSFANAYYLIDVTESVRAWHADPASADEATVENRPKLIIRFSLDSKLPEEHPPRSAKRPRSKFLLVRTLSRRATMRPKLDLREGAWRM